MNGSGAANLYVNGVSAISGQLTPPSGNIQLSENFIAKSNNPSNGFFDGRMNDVQFWETELTQTEIQDWMYKDVDPTHSSYADLKFYYKLDDMNGITAMDASSNSNDGTLAGPPAWRYTKGDELFRNLYASNERPNLGFIQGTYTSYLDSVVFMDSVLNTERFILVSNLAMDVANGGYDHVYVDTLYGWVQGYSYIYDENEMIIDSVWNGADVEYYNYYTEENKRIARYITPYGNYLDLGAGFTWVYDLTHLEPWLHGNIDLQGGDNRELIDLRFEFIEGTPPRTVNSVEKILTSESNQYSFLVATPATSTLTPDPASDMFGIHYSVTGHAFNNATNCAEFCARTHYFEVDGNRVHDWLHMKECADNALYPQGGTWIYDRTGWCPGEAVDWFDLDLTSDLTAGTPVTLTYGVDPDPSGTEYGNWSRTMFFISYSNPNFDLDAEVYDIISPNSWEYYGRYNPICDNPVIEIRNSGATTLTTVEIEYGVVGGTPQTFTWFGNLDFMDVERVVLPMHQLWLWSGSSTFYSRIVSTNGATDEYADNDRKESSFEAPPTHDADIELNLKTNSAGSETSWDLRDGQNNIIYSSTTMTGNTVYDTPMTLPIGCYTLNVYDSGDDGLDFWANNDGVGYCRIKNSTGQVIKTFEPDFGDNIHYQFSVGESVYLEEIENSFAVNVFPNPSTGEFNIQLKNLEAAEATLEVFDAFGSLVFKKQMSNSEWIDSEVEVDLSNQANGIYTLKLSTPNGNAVRRLTKN